MIASTLVENQFLDVEARVGIEQDWCFHRHRSVQLQLSRPKAHRITGSETACKMGVMRRFVKSPSTQALLVNKWEKTPSGRLCWHFCWHFRELKLKRSTVADHFFN